MSSASALLDSYRERDQLFVLVLTAAIMFLDGLALVYRWFLREVNYQQMGLSPVNEFAYVFGPILFEPVLLFGALYYTARRIDGELPVWTLIPGLAVAVVLGGLAGQFTGIDTWPAATPLTFAQGYDLLLLHHPQALLYWQDFLGPLVRALLTAIAALGLAQARD